MSLAGCLWESGLRGSRRGRFLLQHLGGRTLAVRMDRTDGFEMHLHQVGCEEVRKWRKSGDSQVSGLSHWVDSGITY